MGSRRQGYRLPGTMDVNIFIILSTASVFPHYSDAYGADVKIKMLNIHPF